MVRYPIHVERDGYRGNDSKKRQKSAKYNEDATMLEKHINEQIMNGKRGIFLYGNIAREVGLSEERVAKILFSVDCGHNGFTILDTPDQPSS